MRLFGKTRDQVEEAAATVEAHANLLPLIAAACILTLAICTFTMLTVGKLAGVEE